MKTYIVIASIASLVLLAGVNPTAASHCPEPTHATLSEVAGTAANAVGLSGVLLPGQTEVFTFVHANTGSPQHVTVRTNAGQTDAELYAASTCQFFDADSAYLGHDATLTYWWGHFALSLTNNGALPADYTIIGANGL